MAEVLDIFAGDAFGMASMTDSINHADYKPDLLGTLGLFEEEGIPTRNVIIEEEYQTLSLVQTAPYGGPATPKAIDKRKARSFIVPHIPVNAAITAEEIQNVRAYANGMTPSQALLAATQLRDKKLMFMRADLEATLEYHRVNAVKGILLDADGTTIYNLFTEFGVVQQTATMVLDTTTTNVNAKIRAAVRLSMTALGAGVVSGWAALCGDSFFDKFIGHAKVEDKYLNWAAAADLGGQHRAYGAFNFGGVTWYNYRGSTGGSAFITTTKAYLFPLGVRGLFIGKFGPADYIDRVNNIPSPDGLPIEARSEMKPMAKGMDLEAQSNPLMLCTKPRAVIELAENT